MAYEVFKKNYEILTEEQQMIVYNLVLSLVNLNAKLAEAPAKRMFGKFAGKAKATFSDSWEMTEEELCAL